MSYQPNHPFDSASSRMITSQQCSDLISYGQIITNLSCASATQIYLENLITLSNKDNLNTSSNAYSILLRTNNFTSQELINNLFEELANNYQTSNGGYTSLLNTSNGRFLLQLV